ncbi:hypothetical protein PUN4_1070012 [Paraburkholderia unamae]|nr:hypothetical protein PUN4_1070012 [Paraburkholderia unamae]
MASGGTWGDEAFESGRGQWGRVPLAGAAAIRDAWRFSARFPQDHRRRAASGKRFQ